MNKQKGKRKRGHYNVFLKKPNPMNISFAQSARVGWRFPLFYCISKTMWFFLPKSKTHFRKSVDGFREVGC